MDAMQRHEETVKQKNRTRLLVFLLLLTLAVLLSALFLFFSCRYDQTTFSIIRENDPPCTVIDGFLYPKTGTGAIYSYHLNTGELKEYHINSLDLSDYEPIGGVKKEDLSLPFSYFMYENTQVNAGEESTVERRICASDPALAPLNRANTDTHFIVRLSDGRKLILDESDKTARPLFFGSVEGVDEYGLSIDGFSYLGGSVAAGIENGDRLLLYRRGDEGFAISDFQVLDLSGYGRDFSLFFCNERYLQLVGSDNENDAIYLVCDAHTGEIRPSPTKEDTLYDSLYLTPYGRAYLPQSAKPDPDAKTPFTRTILNVSLGTESVFRFSDPIVFAKPLALSTTGAYGVFEVYGKSSDDTLSRADTSITVSKAGGRQADLSECLNEGEYFVSAVFLSDTILAVETVNSAGESAQKIVKICF